MNIRSTHRQAVPIKALLGDAIGLAAICVMVLMGLSVPSLF